MPRWTSQPDSFSHLRIGFDYVFRNVLLLSLTLLLPAIIRADQPGLETKTNQPSVDSKADYVRVEGVASDQLSIDVEVGPPADFRDLHLAVKDTVVKDRLKQLQGAYLTKKAVGTVGLS